MTSDASEVTIDQKEACSVLVMRTMLEDYCDQTGVAFEDALLAFAQSGTYDLLFDYSTGLWREGPDYLRSFFDDRLGKSRQAEAS